MKILIPTAKELNKKAIPHETVSLSEKSTEIVSEIVKMSVEDLAKGLQNQRWEGYGRNFLVGKILKNNMAKSYKALELFNGLMYRNIARDNFDETDKKYIRENVFITTSLYGV